MFRDKFGNLSSKRITGFGILCYTCVVVFLGGFSFFSPDKALIISLLGTGTTLLGLGVLERNK